MTYHVVLGTKLFKSSSARDTISSLIQQHDTAGLKGTYECLRKCGMSRKLAKVIVGIITDNGEKFPYGGAVFEAIS